MAKGAGNLASGFAQGFANVFSQLPQLESSQRAQKLQEVQLGLQFVNAIRTSKDLPPEARKAFFSPLLGKLNFTEEQQEQVKNSLAFLTKADNSALGLMLEGAMLAVGSDNPMENLKLAILDPASFQGKTGQLKQENAKNKAAAAEQQQATESEKIQKRIQQHQSVLQRMVLSQAGQEKIPPALQKSMELQRSSITALQTELKAAQERDKDRFQSSLAQKFPVSPQLSYQENLQVVSNRLANAASSGLDEDRVKEVRDRMNADLRPVFMEKVAKPVLMAEPSDEPQNIASHMAKLRNLEAEALSRGYGDVAKSAQARQQRLERLLPTELDDFGRTALAMNFDPENLTGEQVAAVQARMRTDKAKETDLNTEARITAERRFPERVEAGEAEKIAKRDVLISNFEDLESIVTRGKIQTGPIDGLVLQGKIKTGAGLTDEEAKANRIVVGARNTIINLLSGAAVSVQEAQRIRAQLPDFSQPEKVFRQNLRLTLANERMLRAKIAELRRRETGNNSKSLPGSEQLKSEDLERILEKTLSGSQ